MKEHERNATTAAEVVAFLYGDAHLFVLIMILSPNFLTAKNFLIFAS